MKFQEDFREFIRLLNESQVEYLIVGGYAVALYGYPRLTGDLDVWVKPSLENARKVMNVLRNFGFSTVDLSEKDFSTEYKIIQLGYPPVRIDIVTTVDGLTFGECFAKKNEMMIDDLKMNFIQLDHLKINKKIVGRPKDIDDLENLK
ncbi:MAG: hypothetical protein C0417_07140 [Chlorobiaceae bacterium]|nr:hypothetical protein [Chlorobiaceae bacterium]